MFFFQKNGAGLHTASSCYWDNSTDGKGGRDGFLELKYLNISRQLHCPLGEQDHVLHCLGVWSGHLGSFSSNLHPCDLFRYKTMITIIHYKYRHIDSRIYWARILESMNNNITTTISNI